MITPVLSRSIITIIAFLGLWCTPCHKDSLLPQPLLGFSGPLHACPPRNSLEVLGQGNETSVSLGKTAAPLTRVPWDLAL